MKKLMYKWHGRLAWIMAVPILLWALSGVLHPLMSNWFKPDIAKRFLPAVEITPPANQLTVAEICADFEEVHMVKTISLQGKAALFVVTPDQKQHYRDCITGKPIADGEQLYAEQLARAYLDDQDSALVKITKIEEFSSSYSYIHRFLPVYRVELDRADGIQVVVDPRTGKLAAYDNSFRRVASVAFSWLHTWSFLGPRDSVLRITIVSLMSLGGFLLAISGIVSIFAMRGKRKMNKRRRWHRVTGIATVMFYLMFTFSGFFHVVMKFNYDDSDTWVSTQVISTKQLAHSLPSIISKAAQVTELSPEKVRLKELTLAQVKGENYFRVAFMGERMKAKGKPKSGPVVYVQTHTLNELAKGETLYAQQLALEFSGYQESDITEVEMITNFRNDYSFIFRRMPVWRVKFAGKKHWQYTVDTRDAHMSMRTSTPGLIEALSFINFHKYHFLDFAGKTCRDVVLLILMALFTTLTISGMFLLKKKKASN